MTDPWFPPASVARVIVGRPQPAPEPPDLAHETLAFLGSLTDDARFQDWHVASAPRAPFSVSSAMDLAAVIEQALAEERPPGGAAIVRLANGRAAAEYVDVVLTMREDRELCWGIELRLASPTTDSTFQACALALRRLAQWLKTARGHVSFPLVPRVEWGAEPAEQLGWISLLPAGVDARAEEIVAPATLEPIGDAGYLLITAPRPFDGSTADRDHHERVCDVAKPWLEKWRHITRRSAPPASALPAVAAAPNAPAAAAFVTPAPPPAAPRPMVVLQAAPVIRSAPTPAPAPQTTVDLSSQLNAIRAALPFGPAQPAAAQPVIPTTPAAPSGTVDLTIALRAAGAHNEPAGAQLTWESHARLHAELSFRSPAQRLRVLMRHGLPDSGTWDRVDHAWQTWLNEDPTRRAEWERTVAAARQDLERRR